MRRAFTLVEMLVVVGILGIMVALLLPALARAQQASLQATCLEREHHLGMSLASLRISNDDRWNLMGCTMLDTTGEFLAIALDEGYIEDAQYLLCPNLNTPHPRKPHLMGKGLADTWNGKARRPYPNGKPVDWWGIEEMAYFFDESRVDQNSEPARAILGDGIEMCTKYGPEPANHADGSNVLYVDQAVQWVAKVQPQTRWLKVDGQYSVGGGVHAAAATKGPWVRNGYIPNPRLNEDGVADDLDDIYECEGTPPQAQAGSPNVSKGGGDPDVANAFFEYAKEHRCDAQQGWGGPSKTDCALGGGLALTWWETWRGGMRDPKAGPVGYSWYTTHGLGYQGLVWGCPQEFEGRINEKW